MLSGGGTFSKVGDVTSVACGNVTTCSGDEAGIGYSFGAAYWFLPYVAAEGTYIQPADATATGGTDTYQFTSVFEPQVLTIVGKVGIPLGPFRPYGQVGGSYHQAKFTTNQTMTLQPTPNTQSYQLRTSGWGFTYGGGVEMWFSSVFGLYGEFGSSAVKGDARDNTEGAVDDRLTYVLFGARVHIGW